MRNSGNLAKIILVIGALLWLVAITAISSALPAQAATRLDPGTVASSPASGPAETLITVSGSNWQVVPDGTAVTFGYSPNVDCSGATMVGGSQQSTVQGGVFSGGFRWPMGAGTPATTYTICAQFGDIPQPAPSSNTFTLLPNAQPRLSVSPATVTAGQHATVSGNNFLPAGTSVALTLKGSGGNVNLGSVSSDSSGNISKMFTVPSSMTGVARVDASAGTGMTASATFTINAVVPTATPKPSPTATPLPTATSAATTTSTSSTPTTPTTGQANRGSTPVPASTPNSAQANTSTGFGGLSNFLFIGMASGVIIVLAAIMIIILSLRGRKQGVPTPGLHSQHLAPFQQQEASRQPLNYSGVPSYVDAIIHGEPVAPQSLNYSGVPSYVDAIIHGEPAMPEPPITGSSPWAQLRVSNMATTNMPADPRSGAHSLIDELTRPMPANAAAPPIPTIPPGPALEAAIRQAQAGLLIVPSGPRRGNRSPHSPLPG
ncbi:MAG: hypothetical protein H0W02_16740 [Ktedonobacteraceae bacterium]|nr:hypothetical protein [Ktedonobacteraceae bacterium]